MLVFEGMFCAYSVEGCVFTDCCRVARSFYLLVVYKFEGAVSNFTVSLRSPSELDYMKFFFEVHARKELHELDK